MNIRYDFSGKTALVTGAATGMGKAMAMAFAGAGANVAVWDVNDAEGAVTVEECNKMGVHAEFYHVDVSDLDSVMDIGGRTLKDFGDVDCLISNAGIVSRLNIPIFGDGYIEDFRRMMDVNVMGFAYLLQAFVNYLKERKQGKIVVTSSIAHYRDCGLICHYAASKAAVTNLARNTAILLGPYNINVNSIAPGHVYTPIFHAADQWAKTNPEAFDATLDSKGVVEGLASLSALHRLQTVEDMAGAVLFLCSEEARNITGEELKIDAGYDAACIW